MQYDLLLFLNLFHIFYAMKPFAFVFPVILVTLLALAGCGTASRSTQEPSSVQQRTPQYTPQQQEVRRERAMRHFIDGSVLETKEQYAEAILEYQEALQFDQSGAIYYALSKCYAALAKAPRAAEMAREAVRREPKSIPYREHLAGIYVGTFQQELAVREYEEILNIDSTYTNARYNIARLSQPTKPLRAIIIYERLLDERGEDWDLLLQIAELNRTLGRFKEAAEKYKRMLHIDPSNKALQRQLAETYEQSGDVDSATALLERMIETDENDVDLNASLANVYLSKGEFSKATPLLDRLVRLGKTNAEVKLRVGVIYFGMVQKDSSFGEKANALFEELRQEKPNDWRPYWYLGGIAGDRKQDSLAAFYFEKVTQLEERNADAWAMLCSNLFDRSQDARVVELAEKAQRIFPKDFRFYLLSGLAYSRSGKQSEAAEMLERCLRLNPNELTALGSLALTYDGMNRHIESDSLYERALKLDPKSAILLNNYSYSLSERELQLQRALEMATQAIAAEPENGSYLDTIGWIYFKLHRYEEAENYIAKSLATGRTSAVVAEHYGDVCFKRGKKAQALEYWQRALELNSQNQSLKEKISRGSL
jgi:tetratricopeptide (TPR) repeat protein